MNEEQAVLNFFSQEENLPLALSVAELVDGIRQSMNNDFWHKLGERVTPFAPTWQVKLTEDRNVTDFIVGLYLQPTTEQPVFLRPMLEQQMIGGVPRIYFGLMWSSAPAPDKLQLAEVVALRNALQQDGFKTNENFLAWQWSPHYPRSKNFLLRFSTAMDALLDEATSLMQHLAVTHGTALIAANAALRDAPRSSAISLDSLRANLK